LAIAGLALLLAIVVGFALAAGPTFLTAAEWRAALTGTIGCLKIDTYFCIFS
jgi:hypothetical protein